MRCGAVSVTGMDRKPAGGDEEGGEKPTPGSRTPRRSPWGRRGQWDPWDFRDRKSGGAQPDGGHGLPWLSTVLIAVLVMAGSGIAARNQPGREALDALARALGLLWTTRVSRAMVKLGGPDRARLVVMAYESGLAQPGWLG